MSYFMRYQSRESDIVAKWIETIPNFKTTIKEIQKANTGFHDIKLVFNDNFPDLIIEVKEDEYFWFEKTENVGFDYISAFNYNNQKIKEVVLYNPAYWIKPSYLSYFLNNITVKKWGKLITCDAHIQLFYVENQGQTVLLNAYSNKKLQEHLPYLNKNNPVRINKKDDYDSSDDAWESAVYFMKPLKDTYLQSIQLKNIESIMAVL